MNRVEPSVIARSFETTSKVSPSLLSVVSLVVAVSRYVAFKSAPVRLD
jgi:hypothetical protein